MSSIMDVNVGLAAVNVLLALALGVVYWRNHREIKSPFTLGLLLFALFLVVHNATLAYHFLAMMPYIVATGELYVLAEGVLQTAALGTLLVATMR